ncbi:hypothetical protein GPK87_03575 [Oscillibacter sp. MCC667]|jgi:hypothetical protein|nr:hypothetical protein [Oscillibacter sp. MCC667]
MERTSKTGRTFVNLECFSESKNLSISVRIPKTRGQAEPQTYGAKKVYKAVFGETAASLTTLLFYKSWYF